MTQEEMAADARRKIEAAHAIPNASPTINSPSDHWIYDLVRTVQECRAENFGQRFGQLLYNLVATADSKKGALSKEYQENFHSRLFYMEDYELANLIKEYKNGRL